MLMTRHIQDVKWHVSMNALCTLLYALCLFDVVRPGMVQQLFVLPDFHVSRALAKYLTPLTIICPECEAKEFPESARSPQMSAVWPYEDVHLLSLARKGREIESCRHHCVGGWGF